MLYIVIFKFVLNSDADSFKCMNLLTKWLEKISNIYIFFFYFLEIQNIFK
jgi:hypothetical protein